MTCWRPYPEYKDSGVPWLGEIPLEWRTTQVKYGYEVRLGKMLASEPSSSLDTLEPYLRAANVYWEGVDTSDIHEMWFSPSEKAQYRLEPGDLVVCEGGDVGRSAIWKGELPECYIQNAVHRVRGKNSYSNRFLYYWLFALKSAGYIDLVCSKATIAHLTAEKLTAISIVVPPLKEQRTIAAFLDHQTAKLDALIAEQRRLIELLQERRAALISLAVTEGLDPDAPMKDPGTSWIGSIPGHWRILQLRRVVRRFVDYRGRTPEKVDDGIPLTTAGNIKNGSIHFGLSHQFIREEDYDNWMVRGLPEVGDVLITTEAPLGESAQVVDPRIALAQRIILLKAHTQRITSDYLKYHFAAKSGQGELWSRATGSTAIGIKAYHLKATLVTVPPLDEQNKITAHLDRETAKIDALIAEIEVGIAHLEEYRTALISAAVTGKIDVRQALPNGRHL